MLKLQSGFAGQLWSQGDDIRAVTIQGDVGHSVSTQTERTDLAPGGYFSSAADVRHSLTCDSETDCLLYVRTGGQFRVK